MHSIQKEQNALNHREYKMQSVEASVMKNASTTEPKWWKLDNAALIYPSNTSKLWPAVFRESAYLKDKVDPIKLQNAVNDVMKRFPFYNVRVKRGLFWYYLEEQPAPPVVKKEDDYPCRRFDLRSKKHVIRILYYQNKISVEVFHSICDGKGLSKFLTALLRRYFELCGHRFGDDKAIGCFSKPNPEEAEDAFARYADFKSSAQRRDALAYQPKGTPLAYGKQLVFSAVMPSDEIRRIAKQKGVSVNDYFVAILMQSIDAERRKFKKLNKPVGVQVPIDIRRFFPSETMRNFASYKYLYMPNERMDFDELAQYVHAETAKIDSAYIMKNINSNVKAQTSRIVKYVPLPIKSIGLRFSSHMFGDRQASTAISNIGIIETPEEMHDLVDRFEFMLGISQYNAFCVACCSYNNQCVLTITSKIEESDIYSDIMRRIAMDGIKIRLISNQEE